MNIDSIRIKNIKVQQNIILQEIFRLSANSKISNAKITHVNQVLANNVQTIEQICVQRQATPANLTTSSRQIYSWMKFLTNEDNLHLHIQSTYHVRQIIEKNLEKLPQSPSELMVEFINFAGLYRGKKSPHLAHLTINEGFINASAEVLRSLVKSALFKNTPESRQSIRYFATSEEYSSVLLELDMITEVITEKAQGNFYNLNCLFNKLNQEYFSTTLTQPRLTWTRINTYRKFGHYEPARDRVVVSLTLDNDNIPEFVVEFVLYHELLHKYHGTKWINGKRMVHTSEFRQDEKKFKFYQEADDWLKKLALSRK